MLLTLLQGQLTSDTKHLLVWSPLHFPNLGYIEHELFLLVTFIRSKWHDFIWVNVNCAFYWCRSESHSCSTLDPVLRLEEKALNPITLVLLALVLVYLTATPGSLNELIRLLWLYFASSASRNNSIRLCQVMHHCFNPKVSCNLLSLASKSMAYICCLS